MLKEAIEKIQEMAKEAWKPEQVELDPKRRHGALLTRDGIEVYEHPQPVRHHSVQSLDSLVEICKLAGAKSIWHNEVAIIAVLSEDRRDQAVLSLTKTTDFRAVEGLRGKISRMQQKPFIDCLTYMLGIDKVVVQPFRRLDWRGSQAAHGTSDFGSSKMGKEIEATVLGIDTLPSEIIVQTKMFRENVGQGVLDLRCAVDIDPQAMTLAIVPDEQDLDAVIEAVQCRIRQAIVDKLQDETVGVYYGSP